jgi:hypothetical protein
MSNVKLTAHVAEIDQVVGGFLTVNLVEKM